MRKVEEKYLGKVNFYKGKEISFNGRVGGLMFLRMFFLVCILFGDYKNYNLGI